MSCAERARSAQRFPLEIRAARTPEATALIWRADGSHPSFPLIAESGSRGIPGSTPLGAITFRELNHLTLAIARSLRDQGIGSGRRVGLLLHPGPAFPLLLLSLLRAGAVAVPVSTRLPAAAVPELLGSIGCRRLLAEPGAAPEAVAAFDVIDPVGLFPGDSRLAEMLSGFGDVPAVSPRAEPVSGCRHDAPAFDPAADATVVFTSGSTGVPKAALHTFENHRASAAGANRNIPLRPGDRWLLSLPLWHVGGLAIVFRCLLGGAAVAIAGKDEPLADAIPGLGASHVSLVATQLFRLLREERGRSVLRGLKAVLLGGGPAPAALVDEAVRAGVRLVASYGSTEMSSQTTATMPDDPPGALRTSGRPLLFREVAIAPDGEILVRGRTLFRGYVDGPLVRPARDVAGWFHTGDLGHLDGYGRLVVAGRRDTMFVSGGENIHPEEIEREILRFPGVLEAIVVPVPDPEFGARPVAYLCTANGALPAEAALGIFLREALPGFKVPKRYFAFPDTQEGIKPDRSALEALARDFT